MRRLWIALLLTLSAVAIVAAPGPALADDDDEVSALAFGSVMIGLGEVPPVASTGRGAATYLITGNGATLYYTLEVLDVSSPITAAHIHLGPRGQNGDVVVNLCGADSAPACASEGVIATGTITAGSLVGPLAGHPLSDLLAAMTMWNTYTNVHTANFPSGEIRGRVLLVEAEEELELDID
jgi:hypothetical protein